MPRAIILSVLTTALALPSAAAAQDRYGAAPAASSAAPARDGAAQPAPSRPRLLSWPGKSTPSNALAAAPASGRPAAGGAPPYKTLSSYRAAPVRPDGGWTPVRLPAPRRTEPSAVPSPSAPAAAPVLAGAPQAAPASIYAPGPPRQAAAAAQAPAQPGAPRAASAAAGTGGQGVRFYSLHRQYGLQPDAAPIPPQFFSASAADLAEPPGPIPTSRTVRSAVSSEPAPTQQ